MHWALEIVCFQIYLFFNEFTFEVTDLFEISRRSFTPSVNFEAAAALKARRLISKHLNMYQSAHSASHRRDAQACCLPSLPRWLPEAQFEIIKGEKERWLSGEAALLCVALASLPPPPSLLPLFLPLFAVLQQAAGRYAPSCQPNSKSSLLASALIRLTQPWTSPPRHCAASLMLHPFSHLSVP